YDDQTHDNMLTLGLEQVRTLQWYTLRDINDTYERVLPGNGFTFLLVYLKVINRGHKSFTDDFVADTPEGSSFRVFYAGYNFTPLSIEGKIQSGTYRWDTYAKTGLDRYNYTWGGLLFEVPESINISQTYLQIDLGRERKPIWKLAPF
ncbi:MAG: hypothetical protein LUO93_01655, partial [Methanomicrobiales archaeon]|nr:hypothetical protein [Methanomicrobiales archaeon]